MHRTVTRWFGMVGCMAVVLLTAAGCFQQAGSGLDASAFSADAPTFTPIPSETPLPPPTEIPTDIPSPTDLPLPTDIPTDIAQVTTVTGVPVVAFTAPTQELDTGIIPVDGAQIALQATTVPLLEAEQPLVQVEQPLVQVDDLALTATSIVQNATATEAFNMTATMQALIGPPTAAPTIPLIFTETPVPLPGQDQQPAVVVPTGADCVHEVRAEDRNLYRLSLLYGVPVVDIARASGVVDIDLILIGQRLIIPGCGTTGAVPPPTSMPTTGAQAGDVVAQPVPGGQSAGGVHHIVEQGQTLFEISLQYGVPVNTIAAANGISNIDLIYLNQDLIIP
jgi:LysM repeat protein